MTAAWRLEVVEDTAAAIHAGSAALVAPPGLGLVRTVRVFHTTDRAVVLGSTQPPGDVDAVRAARAGVSVVRRQSGGGAVLVGPGMVVWVDVVIPASDPLSERDVGRAFWWLGETWAAALGDAGLRGGQPWRGGLCRTRWSARVCFAGLGPGEVTLGSAKVVGMTQRRTRAGALFQCAVPVGWDPVPLLEVLAMADDDRAAAASELAGCAAGVGVQVAGRLIPAFLDRLPAEPG